jgi:hypothetical protein
MSLTRLWPMGQKSARDGHVQRGKPITARRATHLSTSTTISSNLTTMSSRRQSRRVVKADVDYKEDENSGPSEDEVVPTPPTKKRKATGGAQKNPPKRRKGKLSKLPDMPLDVLYEVTTGKI